MVGICMGTQTRLDVCLLIAQFVETMIQLLPVGREAGIDHRERITILDEIPIDAVAAASINRVGQFGTGHMSPRRPTIIPIIASMNTV